MVKLDLLIKIHIHAMRAVPSKWKEQHITEANLTVEHPICLCSHTVVTWRWHGGEGIKGKAAF